MKKYQIIYADLDKIEMGKREEKVKFLEERKEEVKISYQVWEWGYAFVREEWIPKSDFYPYPTKDQLAQMYKKVMETK